MMQGLWLENQQLSYRQDVARPQLKVGEALVKVHLAGICATDLALIQGYYPFTGILGHEFYGEIIEAPSAPARIGERVVGSINLSCGTCPECRAQRPTHCLQRQVLGILNHHGAFADYLSLPLNNLYPVPPEVSPEMAVFTEPLAAALAILEQIPLCPSERVLLIGAGRLGQLIALCLQQSPTDVCVVARYPAQQQLLSQQRIHWVSENDLDHGRFDTVIEATGNPSGFALALNKVRPRGRIVLKSTYKNMTSVDLSQIVVNEISIIGSRCGDFSPALRLLAENRLDPRPLISACYPLSQGLSAFAHAKQAAAMKVLLDCGTM